jgi:hypothetical protein
MFRKIIFTLFIISLSVLVSAQNKPTRNITDASIKGNVTWSADTIYILNGRVFVEDGESLTIPAGTIIKGAPGTGENASALLVARGGKIFANGTKDKPIIFTAQSDNVDNLNDLPLDARGLWGGVIILGKARINTPTGEKEIEGIPSTETRGIFGGTNDDDNSGVFKYVSIRYGGSVIGANNEINGLTMGGVGRGTTIEYVEVFNNADDGFEWFGGTVNTRYLVSAFNDDDSFDYDDGFSGKAQFWFAIQDTKVGNRMAEQSGGKTPAATPILSIPVIYNATYIGSGSTSANTKNDFGLIFNQNAGGKYYNSIFTDFYGKAIEVEDLTSGDDSRVRLEKGDIILKNNIWFNFGAGSDITQYVTQDFARTYLTDATNSNKFVDPKLRGISRTNNGGLDPRPKEGSPALTGAVTSPSDGFFTNTNYVGAFGPNHGDLWIQGWTFLSQVGIVSNVKERSISGIKPTDLSLSQNYPNPFNPTTEIKFSVPKTSYVKLTVYNILGQKVETLIDGIRPTGNYSITWDASNIANGIYVYKLESGSTVLTKKMTLVK